MLSYLGIALGVVAQRAFFCLDADVGHRLGRGTLDIAVAVGGYTHHRAFGDVERLIAHLETTCAREDDVVLLILLVAVIEGNGNASGQCAKRNLTRCGTYHILYKLLALEAKHLSYRGVGELIAAVQNF